jgi:hypothetical protein
MFMGSFKVKRSREQILQLNDLFQGHKVAPVEFYEQLKSRGVDIALSILIKIYPDGDNTYYGSLINQTGQVCSFDVDCDDEKFTRWEVVELEEFLNQEGSTKLKPWDAEVIAVEILTERGH